MVGQRQRRKTAVQTGLAAAALGSALCLPLLGCGGKEHTLVPVTGQVVVDGEGVANAEVTFEPVSDGTAPLNPPPHSFARTDKDGYFRRWVGPRHEGWTYWVAASPDGYRRLSPGGEVKIDTSRGKRRAEHTFLFYRTGPDGTKISITGQVLGIDGKPASAGYRVTALPQAWSSQSGERRHHDPGRSRLAEGRG